MVTVESMDERHVEFGREKKTPLITDRDCSFVAMTST
jgi:hypothetical protein